jgi:hypothetical protein
MKYFLITLIIILLPFIINAQSSDALGRFGITINSSLNGELDPVRIVPSVVYAKGNNQFELGVGFNPGGRESQKLLSSELNYKYYPNGNSHKFNMYLLTHISYVNRKQDSYYPAVYNYFYANAGYGFEIKAIGNLFMGTNVSLGTYTFRKESENPNTAFARKKMFDEFSLNLAFQFNLGYRF